MSSTILIVEDQQVLREIMKEYLLDEGYRVIEASDGAEALELFYEHDIDLIILDIMLPELDGWSVCRRIRKSSNVPILMLTSRADEDDTLLGFELGADDYVVKPCSPPILLARTKRLLATQQVRNLSDTLVGGSIVLQLSSRTVTLNGKPIHLTHTEFEILASLLKNKSNIVSRESLLLKIWGYEYSGDDRTLSSHVRNLRSKLGEHAKHITTVVRSGYKFEDQP